MGLYEEGFGGKGEGQGLGVERYDDFYDLWVISIRSSRCSYC